MALTPGMRIGPYEIVSLLGAGGMGAVYSARDVRLGRQVAIKLVLDAFLADHDRTIRFEQEAKTLASLNHPNIATLHGIEDIDGRHLLVMEYVDGETLADRVARHPSGLPLEDALHIARQIAAGLEAAHERGIVHRDLKPANVKITAADTVKVLDFGLAKAISGAAGVGSADLMDSPTFTSDGTALGTVLGTAAYMAPEQARGRPVDTRADIWAFGAVLFEMLTGRRLFGGETASDIIAAVLTKEPDFDSLPGPVPPEVRHVLRRCLERDPRRRLRDIGDARLELEGPFAAQPEASSTGFAATATARGGRPIVWIALGLGVPLILSLAGIVALWRGPEPVIPAATIQFEIPPPAGTGLVLHSRPAVAISSDGATIALVASRDGESHLYLRARSEVDIREIPGTLGASEPAFSPDGRWIAFATGSHLVKISVDGKTRIDLTPVVDPRGLAWLDDQSLVVAPNVGSGLFLVPAAGGPSREITTIVRERGERSHRWPAVVPGARAVLFTVGTESSPDDYNDAHIEAVVIATGERKPVLHRASTVRCTADGRLLFMRRGVMYGVRFDAEQLQTVGEPVVVLPGVEGDATTGAGHFSVSAEGTLAYVPGLATSGQRRLVWADRTGNQVTIDIPPSEFNEPAISPDSTRLAVVVGTIGRADLWTYEFGRQLFSRLTFEGSAATPWWSADGQSVYYTSIDPTSLETTLLRKRVDGTVDAERLTSVGGRVYLGYVDPQERFAIAMQTLKGEAANSNIIRIPLQPPGPPVNIVATAALEYAPAVSPDGRWMAYVATVSGVQEVWVREMGGTGQWQISTSGGIGPRWSADGRELFFRQDTTQMMAPIDAGAGFRAGQPRPLFSGVYNWRTEAGMNYTIDPRTGRFLMILPPAAGTDPKVRVIANWKDGGGR